MKMKKMKMSKLTGFVGVVEGIVESELQTLRDYIVEHAGEKTKTLTLDKFYEFVYQWSEDVWVKRQGPDFQLKKKDNKKKDKKKKKKDDEEGVTLPVG